MAKKNGDPQGQLPQKKIESAMDDYDEINKEIDKIISEKKETGFNHDYQSDLDESNDSIDFYPHNDLPMDSENNTKQNMFGFGKKDNNITNGNNINNYQQQQQGSQSFNNQQHHNHQQQPQHNHQQHNHQHQHQPNHQPQQQQQNVDMFNNSFSYTCPYVQSNTNPFFHFGFPRLNQVFCPHMPGNAIKQMNNTKKYSKRMVESIDIPKNKIHLDNVLKKKDKRTTVIIRNIPNKYSLEIFLQEINIHFKKKYDIVYLPIDNSKNNNLGFGFVNFIDPIHLIYFFDEFNAKPWKLFNSNKQCMLAYAKIQGKEPLVKYIQKNLGSGGSNDLSLKSFLLVESNDMSDIEIPMVYYQVFMKYYPYSSCKKKNDNIFIVIDYYNFH